MVPRTKLLDELAEQHVAPVMKAAGFRKSGKRRWLAGQAPGNLVLLEVRPHHIDFHRVGFWVEWAVIPAPICDYESRDSPNPRRPHITWGILTDRVRVPPENAVADGFDETLWLFSAADGTEEIGEALRRLFTDGGLLDGLSRMCDREHLLRVLDVKSRAGKSAGTPSGWPWRYLAMYIDDGDPDVLEGMLAPLEERFPEPDVATPWRQRYHEISVWFRQRLNVRLAEQPS